MSFILGNSPMDKLEKRDQFEFLTCTIVADTPATYSGLKKHLIEKSSPAVLGPRAIILTGTHGFADTGEDGLINLKCLKKSMIRSKKIIL